MSPVRFSKIAKWYLSRRGYVVERCLSPATLLGMLQSLQVSRIDLPLIRLGPAGDGGYLVPDDLEGLAAVISPGVAQECGFDLAMAGGGVPVLMADASVDGPPAPHPLFRFQKKFLGTYASSTTLRMEDLCACAPEGDLLLQMDIEGAEYQVIDSLSDDLAARFRIMIIEFHQLTSLFTHMGYATIERAFRKLLQTHRIVHIHPNNCCEPKRLNGITLPDILEITFHRRDRAREVGIASTFPHPLDHPCVADRPDLDPADFWYANAGLGRQD